MKRTLLFLSALLMGISGAWAETQTATNMPTDKSVYYLSGYYNGTKTYLYYNSDDGALYVSSTLDETDWGYKWECQKSGNYYGFKNIESGTYLGNTTKSDNSVKGLGLKSSLQTFDLAGQVNNSDCVSLKATISGTVYYFCVKNSQNGSAADNTDKYSSSPNSNATWTTDIYLEQAPTIPTGSYSISFTPTDGSHYYRPSKLFELSKNNLSTTGIYALTLVNGSYDTYYIQETGSNKYLYEVNAAKADYENNGNVTTYGASSEYKYRFHANTTNGKAVDLASSLPDGDKSSYQWKIQYSSTNGEYNIIPSTNTKTALGVWTESDGYFSFLETDYSWGHAKFTDIKSTVANYYDSSKEANVLKAGKVGYPKTSTTTYSELMDLLRTFTPNYTYTYNDFYNLVERYLAYIAESDVVYPSAGKFYKLYHPTQEKYLYAKAADNSTQLTVETDGTVADAIFYTPENNCFVSYLNGYYIVSNKIYNVPGGKSTFKISHYSGHDFGMVTLYSGNRYFYAHTDNKVYNDSQDQTSDAKRWIIQEVTSLPITIGTSHYGTIYSPVALQIAEGDMKTIAAYSSSVDTEKGVVTLTKIESGTIPAGKGIVLNGTPGTYNLTVVDKAEDQNSIFSGSYTTIINSEADIKNEVASNILTIQTINDVPGLYGYNGATLKGFKAWIDYSKLDISATRALTMVFGEATGIDVPQQIIMPAAAYDLQGRRVERPVSGLYIINGKKVFIK